MNDKKRNDPFYFAALKCEDCGSVKDLYTHRILDTVKCVDCINKLLELASSESEGVEE